MTATTATVVDPRADSVEAAKDTHPAGGRCAAHKEQAASPGGRATQDAWHTHAPRRRRHTRAGVLPGRPSSGEPWGQDAPGALDGSTGSGPVQRRQCR